MEKMEEPRKKSSKLGLAGLAVLSTLGIDQADAGSARVANAMPQVQNNLDSSITRPDPAWFLAKLSAIEHVKEGDMRKMEAMVMGNGLPLTLQIDFLERSLKDGNAHNQELKDSKLTSARLSEIIRLIDVVSSRLTIAYDSKDTAPAELQKYFNIGALRASSRYLYLTPQGSPADHTFCNGFLMRAAQDAYFITDAHCTMGTTTEKAYFYPSSGADVALQRIVPQDFAAWGIADAGSLPELSHTPRLATSGKIIASFSWGLDPRTGDFDPNRPQEKVHYSFAVPLPPSAVKVMYRTDSNKLSYIQDSIMFLKPHGEGEAVRLDKQNMPVIAAAGTSGSVVGIYESGNYSILGNLQSVARLDDTCRYLCYAVSYSTSSNTLQNAIAEEQRVRSGTSPFPRP